MSRRMVRSTAQWARLERFLSSRPHMAVGTRWWTDYPFVELGDVAGQPAPVRRVTYMGRDGDKWVHVLVDGVRTTVKWGYLRRNRAAVGR